jgi:hypothetical protein
MTVTMTASDAKGLAYAAATFVLIIFTILMFSAAFGHHAPTHAVVPSPVSTYAPMPKPVLVPGGPVWYGVIV